MKRTLLGFLGGFATVASLCLSYDPATALMLATDLTAYAQRAQELLTVFCAAFALSVTSLAFAVRKGLVVW